MGATPMTSIKQIGILAHLILMRLGPRVVGWSILEF